MSVRRPALLLAIVALLMLGSTLTSAAQAAPTDPVTGLTVNQAQTPGHHDRWSVTASWDANGASSYTVQVVANADGSGTPYAGPQDTASNSITLTTTGLLAGQTYYVAVFPTAAGSSAVVTEPFVAVELDTTAPTATFTVAPTHAWLAFDFMSLEEAESASVKITQTSAVEAGVARKVVAGDGTASRTWASGSSLTITYTGAGTFTPKVTLTDGFGNSRTLSLSPVTVAEDGIAPVIHIARPSSSLRDRISGWRKIRGTAADGQTGVDTVVVMVVQKRGGYWYVYNFHKRVWVKGRTGQIATLIHTKARPALLTVDSLGQWHTSRIRGLKTGKLVVRGVAFDESINFGRDIVRQRITRS